MNSGSMSSIVGTSAIECLIERLSCPGDAGGAIIDGDDTVERSKSKLHKVFLLVDTWVSIFDI